MGVDLVVVYDVKGSASRGPASWGIATAVRRSVLRATTSGEHYTQCAFPDPTARSGWRTVWRPSDDAFAVFAAVDEGGVVRYLGSHEGAKTYVASRHGYTVRAASDGDRQVPHPRRPVARRKAALTAMLSGTGA